ncbi:hypothetical protein NEMIN01_2037 [Nematocida minor]|uniref:uncharacterized protein n=1 Tax=Nematocida minor TaxID=1912983 RepID=UPI00222089B3|nr:uncharacterized protein NEMIN01_2037 [Nematocida minor]KAI5192473.1 hypothetical protein NEMIN01_2037 [Nematocida minor]
MAREYEDELEFFSFLPTDFHIELYQGMSRALVSSLGSTGDIRGRIDKIETALQKNMLIFERFTLRNIFTFPDDFVYGRKATNTPPPTPEHLKERILDLTLKKTELSAAQELLLQKEAMHHELSQKFKSIQGIPDLSPIIDGVTELNHLMRETREIKNKYIQGQPKHRPAKKELEDEIRKNECDDLERRIPIAILSSLEKSL